MSTIVQHTDLNSHGEKTISINGVHWLTSVRLGEKVSQSDFDGLKRGDRVFVHFGADANIIHSITKYEDIPESVRNIGLREEIKVH